jgi:hypothetical protein
MLTDHQRRCYLPEEAGANKNAVVFLNYVSRALLMFTQCKECAPIGEKSSDKKPEFDAYSLIVDVIAPLNDATKFMSCSDFMMTLAICPSSIIEVTKAVLFRLAYFFRIVFSLEATAFFNVSRFMVPSI